MTSSSRLTMPAAISTTACELSFASLNSHLVLSSGLGSTSCIYLTIRSSAIGSSRSRMQRIRTLHGSSQTSLC